MRSVENAMRAMSIDAGDRTNFRFYVGMLSSMLALGLVDYTEAELTTLPEEGVDAAVVRAAYESVSDAMMEFVRGKSADVGKAAKTSEFRRFVLNRATHWIAG